MYLEEFLLVARGSVGLLLRNSFAQLWEQGNRPTFFEADSGRFLAWGFSLYGRSFVVGSNYSSATPAPRKAGWGVVTYCDGESTDFAGRSLQEKSRATTMQSCLVFVMHFRLPFLVFVKRVP